ncbi:MAG: hypothetical protein WBA84_11080 [Carnobacterium sp.]|uniref:hypothetical protein n=1 Tax=Carnobacterium sp. TaxID=48221 RepID=UPI003C708824
MSINEKYQNEHEKKCIDIIKSKFSVKNCFGLTTENYSIMEKCLEEIVPNEKSNEFPDFVFPNGFVEHFMITSSKLDKKGAAHKIAISKFEQKNEELAKKLSDQKPTYRNSFEYNGHSHSNLVNSFEINWNKHIGSLEKYRGKKDNGIFLVEYFDTAALSMAELKLEGTDGLFTGDYKLEQEIIYGYRLSRDKKLLKWLYQFEDRIEYVIFLTEESVEIIKLSNILKLLKVLPYDYAIAPNMTLINDRGILL